MRDGKTVPIPGLATPGRRWSWSRALATVAPLLPALKQASARPVCTILTATPTLERGWLRTALAGWAPMGIATSDDSSVSLPM